MLLVQSFTKLKGVVGPENLLASSSTLPGNLEKTAHWHPSVLLPWAKGSPPIFSMGVDTWPPFNSPTCPCPLGHTVKTSDLSRSLFGKEGSPDTTQVVCMDSCDQGHVTPTVCQEATCLCTKEALLQPQLACCLPPGVLRNGLLGHEHSPLGYLQKVLQVEYF